MMQFETIQIKNNFENLKEQFSKDTGKNWDEDLNVYISYVNMKINDYNMQFMNQLLKDVRLSNGILFEKLDGFYKERIKPK